jgi:uncharacterized protein (TIGR02996 family)
MPETDTLFQAILADPGDDGLRLIYADWLEERGDEARAEFIRVQCALAKMDKDDPRRAELELRERELLAGHREAWLGELPSWEGITWEKFERGFITGIQITLDAFRAHADELFRLVPVDSVCFDNLTVNEARWVLADLPHLARLTELSFQHTREHDRGIGDVIALALAESPFLTRLTRFRLGSLGDKGLKALACSPNLRRLTSLWFRGRFSAEGIATLVASPHLDHCGTGRLASSEPVNVS